MGLGSIMGTGVFVSIGTAVEIAGWGVVLAIALSAFVAICNGLNSAQLASAHPVSGGTYEYGYKYLNSWWGFSAGWLFLLAKSASAATAALGFAGYFTNITGIDPQWQTALAVAVVVGFTAIAALGISRSNLANTIIVSTTLLVLAFFCHQRLQSSIPAKCQPCRCTTKCVIHTASHSADVCRLHWLWTDCHYG